MHEKRSNLHLVDDLPGPFNVAAWLLEPNLRERPEKIAIECGDERVSYRQIWERVCRTGSALKDLGVRMEERIALLLLDTPEFAYCFLGAISIGAVAVPLNTLLLPPDYKYLLNDSRARVLFVSEPLLSKIQPIGRGQLPFLEKIIVVGNVRAEGRSFADLIARQSSELVFAPTSKDDAAFWLYSSGSTGAPKGCVHLHHDIPVCVEQYAKGVLQMGPDDRCFSVAKLFFAYGLGNALYFPMALGATSILSPAAPAPQHVFEVIRIHHPTFFFSVPSNYAALLAQSREPGLALDLSSLRYGISAGEALPAAIFHRFQQRFGVEILDAIGSTEALHMFIANRPGAVRAGSSGQLIPGCQARIVDEEGALVSIGQVGNLLIKSDATCACYWNQHEKSKQTFLGEWLRTGDKYRQDEDGYFWYEGRSDDMLKVSGAWVSPVEIEGTLLEHSLVQQVGVVGRQDADGLVKPIAYVVLSNAAQPSPALANELVQFVSSRLPSFKRPRWVEFVESLPTTATGKLQRYKLRERAARSVTW